MVQDIDSSNGVGVGVNIANPFANGENGRGPTASVAFRQMTSSLRTFMHSANVARTCSVAMSKLVSRRLVPQTVLLQSRCSEAVVETLSCHYSDVTCALPLVRCLHSLVLDPRATRVRSQLGAAGAAEALLRAACFHERNEGMALHACKALAQLAQGDLRNQRRLQGCGAIDFLCRALKTRTSSPAYRLTKNRTLSFTVFCCHKD